MIDPTIADRMAARPPTSHPNRKPPKIVRNTAPGTDRATTPT